MAMTLLGAGGFFAIIFTLYNAVQTLRGRFAVNFTGTLLAFLSTLVPIVAIFFNHSGGDPLPMIDLAAGGIALLVIVSSAIFFLIERARTEQAERHPDSSRGLLGMGAGTLLMVSTLVLPVVTGAFVPLVTPPQTGLAQVAPSDSADADTEPTEAPVAVAAFPTNTPQFEPTPVNTPVVLPELPTREPTLDRTQVAVAPTQTAVQQATQVVAAVDCTGVNPNNLNLRAEPDVNTERISTIPYGTTLTVHGHNGDSTWLNVTYDGQTGWVSGEFVEFVSGCASLPVVQS